jgi:hypothetical protein
MNPDADPGPTTMTAKQGALDVTFEAALEKSDAKGRLDLRRHHPMKRLEGALRAATLPSAGTPEKRVA